ncbi:MAG: NAD(P) transhydrogenase subunit alpha [Oscillospiraceae bacterium]|nr:NAD(P) transhydrogenase subunit alpha [Oscillospiraceae bacterium]
MIIGIPKEIMHDEARVAATPDTVKKYVADGHKVLVEVNAGIGAQCPNEAYAAAGAIMCETAQQVYDEAELILKVKEPLFNEQTGKHEVDMMHAGQYLITFIHPAAPVNHKMVKHMAEAGIISMSIEGVPRISRAQSMDALTSMSTCAGYKGILMAASDLIKFIPMMPTAAGMIKPCNALICGVGVAGLQALATAKRLGAKTYAIDIRPAAAEQATSLGAKVVESGVDPALAIGKGGYAMELPEDVLAAERELIAKVLPDMDIVFLSALVPGRLAPILITEEMVKTMKPGSVIVDIAIDQGGNCAITTPGVRDVKHGVILEGIKNIPGMLAESSTFMYAANMYNLVKYLTKDGYLNLDESDDIVSGMLTTKDGKVVHAGALAAMGG